MLNRDDRWSSNSGASDRLARLLPSMEWAIAENRPHARQVDPQGSGAEYLTFERANEPGTWYAVLRQENTTAKATINHRWSGVQVSLNPSRAYCGGTRPTTAVMSTLAWPSSKCCVHVMAVSADRWP